jgi:hypothetical protein
MDTTSGRDYITRVLWWYWYRSRSPTIVRDGGSKVFLCRYWSYCKASGDIENDGTHSQISTIVCNHRMEGQFHFLALWHTINSKKTFGITWPRGPHHFRLGVSRVFSGWIWKRLEWHKIQSLHGHGMIDHLGSIHFSYAWLYNWEHPFSVWPKGKSSRTLYAS